MVTECARVTEAVDALKRGDIAELGRLLNESHYSLRDLYEVTGKELDMLSALARKEAGCLGSRMIGAGFGGCTISIVKKSAVEGFIRHVDKGVFRRDRVSRVVLRNFDRGRHYRFETVKNAERKGGNND